jgi:2'-5' RNA ligase
LHGKLIGTVPERGTSIMPRTVRTFIAVHLHPSGPLRALLASLADMGPAVRPVAADNLHVTIKFLGETDAALIPVIAQALRECVADHEPFALRLSGLGAFPQRGRPSVVWASIAEDDGAADGHAALCEIAAALEAALEPHGFPRESKTYHPHLTLARIKFKPPPELAELFDQHAATDFGTETVTQVTLYQSDLRPQGPLYTPLATVELPGERNGHGVTVAGESG